MAFWKKIFKSKYTGAEIDAAIAKAGDATKVVANPTLAGTEAALTGLEVGETKYKVDSVLINQTPLTGSIQPLKNIETPDGLHSFINVCFNRAIEEVARSVGNGTIVTKQKAVTLTLLDEDNVTIVDYYQPYLELNYVPSASALQTLLTTGEAVETITGVIKPGSSNYEYNVINIGIGTANYVLNFAGASSSGATFNGFFAVSNDAQFGTGIAIIELTYNISENR